MILDVNKRSDAFKCLQEQLKTENLGERYFLPFLLITCLLFACNNSDKATKNQQKPSEVEVKVVRQADPIEEPKEDDESYVLRTSEEKTANLDNECLLVTTHDTFLNNKDAIGSVTLKKYKNENYLVFQTKEEYEEQSQLAEFLVDKSLVNNNLIGEQKTSFASFLYRYCEDMASWKEGVITERPYITADQGSISIEQQGEEYNIKFELYKNHESGPMRFTGKYTGKIMIEDYTNCQIDSVTLDDIYNNMLRSPSSTSRNKVLWPLKVTSASGTVKYLTRQEWTDLNIFRKAMPLIARDSNYIREGNSHYDFLRLVNFAQKKSYVFQKIQNKLLLTSIEPLIVNEFIEFYTKFLKDKKFRNSNLNFPFIYISCVVGECDSVAYNSNNIHKAGNYYRYVPQDNYFVLLDTDAATKINISIMYDGEGAYVRDEYFEKIDGKWLLTQIIEGGD